MATQNDNDHAATTLRSATTESRNAKNYAHMNTRCGTQRRNRFAPGSSAAAPAAHTRYLSSPAGATLHRKTQGFLPLRTHEQPLIGEHRGGTDSRPVRAQPHPPHTRSIPFIAGRSDFTRKNARFPAPAFPQNEATSMQPLQCVLQLQVPNPASLDAHGKTKPQRSCSHYTAICNHRVKKRKELRTHEHSLQNTEEEPIRARFERSRTRRTHEVPFTWWCSVVAWLLWFCFENFRNYIYEACHVSII